MKSAMKSAGADFIQRPFRA